MNLSNLKGVLPKGGKVFYFFGKPFFGKIFYFFGRIFPFFGKIFPFFGNVFNICLYLISKALRYFQYKSSDVLY
jgi:hypothetical protein